jgi:prophage maintenance system killer protein
MKNKEKENLINTGEVVIYEGKEGINLEVTLVDETIWLSQDQISKLFNKGRSTITEHINNVFAEGELDKDSTCRKFRRVEKEGSREVNRSLEIYNLDLILSVGYRVNSLEGTKFRIWATQTLKKYLLQGYVINEKKLKEENEKLKEFKETIDFVTSKIESNSLKGKEKAVLAVIKDYTKSFQLLSQFDEDRLEVENLKSESSYKLTYHDAITFVQDLKANLSSVGENVNLFGNERGEGLKGLIGSVYQTFDGEDLYPSIDEKAAHLLYFVIKDHPFSDGNKRSGAALFLYFLDKNNYLENKEGRKINQTGLVTLALLIAQSDPQEKEIMIKLIINLIKE